MTAPDHPITVRLLARLQSSATPPFLVFGPPCSEAALADLQQDAEARLSVRLPDAYIQLLRLVDGFHYNALYLLASRDMPLTADESRGLIHAVVDDNQDYWDAREDGLIVLGYDEGYAYGFDFKSSVFVRLMRSPQRIIRRYMAFDEMLADALDQAGVSVADLLPERYRLSRTT